MIEEVRDEEQFRIALERRYRPFLSEETGQWWMVLRDRRGKELHRVPLAEALDSMARRELRYEAFQMMARMFIGAQKRRIAIEARIRELIKRFGGRAKLIPQVEDVMAALELHHREALREEKAILKDAVEIMREHPIWNWAKIVDGLGDRGVVFLLGYINPFIANTAGKVKAIFGLIPGARLRAGVKGIFNPEAKGKLLGIIVPNIIMAGRGKGDSYYAPIYRAKKDYILNIRGFKNYIEDPRTCPGYEDCMKALKRKAERLKRKAKKPPCRLHADSIAKRFLGEILISHATEIMREHEELSTDSFKAHHGYIPPKSYKEETPNIELIEDIRMGARAERWK